MQQATFKRSWHVEIFNDMMYILSHKVGHLSVKGIIDFDSLHFPRVRD
jgi:hypothetical protein